MKSRVIPGLVQELSIDLSDTIFGESFQDIGLIKESLFFLRWAAVWVELSQRKVLPKFTQLRVVKLVCPIDTESLWGFVGMRSVQDLTTMHQKEPLLSKRPLKITSSNIARLRFHFMGPLEKEMMDLIVFQVVELELIDIISHGILSEILGYDYPRLEILRIRTRRGWGSSLILSFLVRTPTITRLSLDHGEQLLNMELAPEILPNLSHLDTTVAHLHLVADRPVRHLRILDYFGPASLRSADDLCSDIWRSATPMETLELRFSSSISPFLSASRTAPGRRAIHTLSITFDPCAIYGTGAHLVECTCQLDDQAVACFPQLQTLEITFERIEVPANKVLTWVIRAFMARSHELKRIDLLVSDSAKGPKSPRCYRVLCRNEGGDWY